MSICSGSSESYGLTLAALILVGGSMGDLFGRRRMFLAGVVVFAIASIVCGMASSIQQLILARAVQGVGAAFLVPGSLSLISASFGRGSAAGPSVPGRLDHDHYRDWSSCGWLAHRALILALGLLHQRAVSGSGACHHVVARFRRAAASGGGGSTGGVR